MIGREEGGKEAKGNVSRVMLTVGSRIKSDHVMHSMWKIWLIFGRYLPFSPENQSINCDSVCWVDHIYNCNVNIEV